MTHRGPFQPLLFCDSVNQGICSDTRGWIYFLEKGIFEAPPALLLCRVMCPRATFP